MMWQFGHKSEVVMQNFVNGVEKGLRYLKQRRKWGTTEDEIGWMVSLTRWT